MRTYHVCIIAGDGIGPEVMECTRRVLSALAAEREDVAFRFTEASAGYGAYVDTGEPLPVETVDAARASDAILVGAMDGARLPVNVSQPLRDLRRHLDIHASIRPSRSLKGVPIPGDDIDVTVVREVTEGFYSGREFEFSSDIVCALRVISRAASLRTAKVAFETAMDRRRKVTAVHKRASLSRTDGFFLDVVAEVASDFPDVEFETRNVDACAMEMIRSPEEFDVILATNAFGDILSDVGAGLAGGLGVAPSACIGSRWSYFEPVHGSAPDIAGRGIANPIASILSGAMLVRHLGLGQHATAIENAVARAVATEEGRTPDVGGAATSASVTNAVTTHLKSVLGAARGTSGEDA